MYLIYGHVHIPVLLRITPSRHHCVGVLLITAGRQVRKRKEKNETERGGKYEDIYSTYLFICISIWPTIGGSNPVNWLIQLFPPIVLKETQREDGKKDETVWLANKTTDRGKRECVSWIVREQGGGDIRKFRAYSRQGRGRAEEQIPKDNEQTRTVAFSTAN